MSKEYYVAFGKKFTYVPNGIGGWALGAEYRMEKFSRYTLDELYDAMAEYEIYLQKLYDERRDKSELANTHINLKDISVIKWVGIYKVDDTVPNWNEGYDKMYNGERWTQYNKERNAVNDRKKDIATLRELIMKYPETAQDIFHNG